MGFIHTPEVRRDEDKVMVHGLPCDSVPFFDRLDDEAALGVVDDTAVRIAEELEQAELTFVVSSVVAATVARGLKWMR